MDFGVQRSRSCNALIPENGLGHKIVFPLHLNIIKIHTKTPVELRLYPIDFESKGQGHNVLITKNGFWCITAFPLHVSPGYVLMIME